MNDDDLEDFRELRSWQRAMDFVDLVYEYTDNWTPEKLPDVSVQIRAAAVSIPANIAKGHGMYSVREFAFHLGVAQRALSEVETLLRFSAQPGLPDESGLEPVFKRAAQVQNEITRLLNSLDTSVPN